MFNVPPKFLTLAQLLEKRLFQIPPYQRTYSWKLKERRDMFNDIRRLKSSSETSHFMATVVGLHKEHDTVRIVTDKYDKIDIVDGQQRLTTLVIMLKAIAEKLASLLKDAKTDVILLERPIFSPPSDMNDDDEGETITRTQLKRELRQLQELLVKPDKLSLVLLQTNHDRSLYFANFLREGTLPEVSDALTLADRELLMAMKECQYFVSRWGNPIELLHLLKNQLWFIFQEINDEEEAHTIFEVLNNRGLQVSWLARLKNSLMKVVFTKNQGNRAQNIDDLHQIWGEFYGIVGLHEGIDTEALTFAATLKYQNRKSVSDENKAVNALMYEVGMDAAKAIKISEWLVKVVRAVSRLYSEIRKPIINVKHARLLAVSIILRDFPEKEERELLEQWEKTVFLIFCLGDEDARGRIGDFVTLAKEVLNNLDLSSSDISKRIRNLGAGYKVKIYSDCYTKWQEELRYLLWRYEEHLAESSGQTFSKKEWNQIWKESTTNSIEHILPQSKGWTVGISVHSIGNLLLLPPRKNSELGNKDPKDKADAYLKTRLLIAEEVAKTIQNYGWDEDQIEIREHALIEWIDDEYGD